MTTLTQSVHARCLSYVKNCLFMGPAAVVATTGLLLTPVTTLAQGASAIEEIVVTAQYREENLQEVPISITAMTGESLANKSAGDVIDIAKWTPNLTIDHLGSGWGPHHRRQRPRHGSQRLQGGV